MSLSIASPTSMPQVHSRPMPHPADSPAQTRSPSTRMASQYASPPSAPPAMSAPRKPQEGGKVDLTA